MNTASFSSGLVPIQPNRWVQQLKQEGRTVLKLSISLPRLIGEGQGIRRINKYYAQLADQWRGRWSGSFYQQACAAELESLSASRPFQPWEVQVEYTLTRQTPDLLSLYWDAYENTGNAHGYTSRHGDTWQISSGAPLLLRSLLSPSRRWHAEVLEEIGRQIKQRVATGEGLYFEAWPTLLRKRFCSDRFYVNEEGPVLFYPLYAIAPYAEGIPVFSLASLGAEKEK